MEGSYSKVWRARKEVPREEYTFFVEELMGTIRCVTFGCSEWGCMACVLMFIGCRHEIASCEEKAYDSLPLSDAATLLFFNNMQEVSEFANEVSRHRQCSPDDHCFSPPPSWLPPPARLAHQPHHTDCPLYQQGRYGDKGLDSEEGHHHFEFAVCKGVREHSVRWSTITMYQTPLSASSSSSRSIWRMSALVSASEPFALTPERSHFASVSS